MISHYLTTALRHFRRHKLTTAISVLGLALGLACFMLAYAAVSYVRQSDAHQPNAERIVYLTQQMRITGTSSVTGAFTTMPYVVADLLRTDLPELEKVARVTTHRQSASIDGRASSIYLAYADAELTDIFDFTFVKGDPRALGFPRSAIVTQQLASRLFGTQNPLGRTILLEGKTPVQVRARGTDSADFMPEQRKSGDCRGNDAGARNRHAQSDRRKSPAGSDAARHRGAAEHARIICHRDDDARPRGLHRARKVAS